jgi:hypothetical protein
VITPSCFLRKKDNTYDSSKNRAQYAQEELRVQENLEDIFKAYF